ncbi:MAG: DUF485 domain-containing protein [Pirellulales bacterium]
MAWTNMLNASFLFYCRYCTEGQQMESPSTKSEARLGLVLFAVYFVFYLAFVLTSAFNGQALELLLPGGLNLAIVWGFGLIVLALLLAAVYGWLKKSPLA